jgi:hypothetical protein
VVSNEYAENHVLMAQKIMSLPSAPYLMLLGGRDLQSMGIPEFIFEVSLRLPTSPYWLFVSLVIIISPYYLLVPIVGRFVVRALVPS